MSYHGASDPDLVHDVLMRVDVLSVTYYPSDDLDNCPSPTDQPPDCAVCKDGYARGLGNACLKCSHERRNAVIVVAVVIFVLIVMVIIAGIRSLTHPGEEHNLPLCRMMKAAISRFKGARAYQALKIMVVSWQIVTQASIGEQFPQNSCSRSILPPLDFPRHKL